METKPKRHKKTANLKEEKNRTETMIQILPTNPAASRNPAKYFCILTRRTLNQKTLIGDPPYAQLNRRTHALSSRRSSFRQSEERSRRSPQDQHRRGRRHRHLPAGKGQALHQARTQKSSRRCARRPHPPQSPLRPARLQDRRSALQSGEQAARLSKSHGPPRRRSSPERRHR